MNATCSPISPAFRHYGGLFHQPILKCRLRTLLCRCMAVLWISIPSGHAQAPALQTQSADEEILALAEQPDGDILVGGNFENFAGATRGHLARLRANGSLDPTFNPAPNDNVNSLAVQDDGKIIVGGRFTSIAGQPRIAIARLNPDGTLDPTLSANANQRVTCLAIQADGKIIIAGWFTQVAGTTRNRIARLLPGGQLDTTFNPDVDGDIHTVALDASGRILIGGDIFTVGGVLRRYLARLQPNGALDTTFQPAVTRGVSGVLALPGGGVLTHYGANLARLQNNGSRDTGFTSPDNFDAFSMSTQTDGKTVVGGKFFVGGGNFSPLPSSVARFHTNGSLDGGFTGPTNATVWATAIRSDGGILVADRPQQNTFAFRLIMVGNSVGTQTLTVTGGNQVRWLRSGSLPELESAAFQTSTDGTTWTALGNGIPIAGGWELTGVTPPAFAQIRARGRVRGGEGNGSLGLIQFSNTTNPTQSYGDWAAANVPAGAAAPTDRNGPHAVQNLIAYATGINPFTVTAAALPSASRDPAEPGILKFTYTRSKTSTGISWNVRSSTGLSTWDPATLLSHAKVSEDAARETWEAKINIGPGNLFLHLEVILSP